MNSPKCQNAIGRHNDGRCIISVMDKSTAVLVFESLSSATRLDVYRLLVKHGVDGMVAGEISESLGIAPNNLSFHLKAMAYAGLVASTQEGRFQRYRANIPLITELVAFLAEECCGGDPKKCLDVDLSAICPEISSAPQK